MKWNIDITEVVFILACLFIINKCMFTPRLERCVHAAKDASVDAKMCFK